MTQHKLKLSVINLCISAWETEETCFCWLCDEWCCSQFTRTAVRLPGVLHLFPPSVWVVLVAMAMTLSSSPLTWVNSWEAPDKRQHMEPLLFLCWKNSDNYTDRQTDAELQVRFSMIFHSLHFICCLALSGFGMRSSDCFCANIWKGIDTVHEEKWKNNDGKYTHTHTLES